MGTCKAILRSGSRKGQVCGNSTNGGVYNLCLGHLRRMQKSMNEGEREERRLQGEEVPEAKIVRKARSKRKKPTMECATLKCRNTIDEGVFCKKCLKAQWKKETEEVPESFPCIDDDVPLSQKLERGFSIINCGDL